MRFRRNHSQKFAHNSTKFSEESWIFSVFPEVYLFILYPFPDKKKDVS